MSPKAPRRHAGRPQSLGSERDQRDAEILLDLLQALKRYPEEKGSGRARKIAKVAILEIWESPRLPGRGVKGALVSYKYPRSYPWSKAARERAPRSATKPEGGYGLVLEHILPIGILASNLLAKAPRLNADELIKELNNGLRAVVITKEEDNERLGGPLRSKMPKDPRFKGHWARLEAGGFYLNEFEKNDP